MMALVFKKLLIRECPSETKIFGKYSRVEKELDLVIPESYIHRNPQEM